MNTTLAQINGAGMKRGAVSFEYQQQVRLCIRGDAIGGHASRAAAPPSEAKQGVSFGGVCLWSPAQTGGRRGTGGHRRGRERSPSRT